MLPKDEGRYEFELKVDKNAKKAMKSDLYTYDFTDVTSVKLTDESPEEEQVQKLIKKLVYKKRKSAAQFYEEEKGYGDYDFSRFRD